MFTHFVYEGVFSAAAVSMAVKTSKDSRTKKEHNFFSAGMGPIEILPTKIENVIYFHIDKFETNV